MSLLLRTLIGLTFSLPVLCGHAQGLPQEDTSTQFYRDSEPEVDRETDAWVPPGPAIPEADARIDENRPWRFKNGKSARLLIAGWGWEKVDGPGGAPRWVLCLVGTSLELPEDATHTYRADEFDPAESKNILTAVWARHYLQSKHLRKMLEYVNEAKRWVGRIATYTGDEPRDPGKPWLPGAADPRMKQAPDIRTLWSWDLRRPRGGKGRAGRFRVLDWAMEEQVRVSENFVRCFGKGAAISVRVKFEDGTEETLASGWIGNSPSWGFFHMALWNDWAKLLRAGGEIPHRDMKIRALQDTLPELWFRELFLEASPKGPLVVLAPLEAVDAADFAERSKGFREGEALSFPGLPPEGFQRIRDSDTDRLKIDAVWMGPSGAGARQCLGFGMAAWMAWWQELGLVTAPAPVPGFGAIKWFNANVPREMPPPQRNALLWPLFAKRLNDFGARLYRNQVFFQVHYDRDYSPSNLMRYTQGEDATFLSLTVIEGRNQTGAVALPLLSASDDGRVTLNACGGVIECRVSESKRDHLPFAGTAKGKLPLMELEIIDAPESALKTLKNVRLVLESNLQDGIIAVTPYTRGKSGIAPKSGKGPPPR